jgi:hypothetical protein
MFSLTRYPGGTAVTAVSALGAIFSPRPAVTVSLDPRMTLALGPA